MLTLALTIQALSWEDRGPRLPQLEALTPRDRGVPVVVMDGPDIYNPNPLTSSRLDSQRELLLSVCVPCCVHNWRAGLAGGDTRKDPECYMACSKCMCWPFRLSLNLP